VGRECEIESHGADCLDVSRLDSCVEDIVVANADRYVAGRSKFFESGEH
jgi:hypothetical protein